MTTEAALTKLAYLLALPGATSESVTKNMSISIRGELTESSRPVFRHPDSPLPDRVQTLTILGYAIVQGDLERVKELIKIEHNWLLNDADYSGNTPVVSLFYLSTTSHTNSAAHRRNVTLNRHPPLSPPSRRLCPFTEPQRPHSPIPRCQRWPLRARSPPPQVGRALALRRAIRRGTSCASETGHLGSRRRRAGAGE